MYSRRLIVPEGDGSRDKTVRARATPPHITQAMPRMDYTVGSSLRPDGMVRATQSRAVSFACTVAVATRTDMVEGLL